LRHFGVFRCIGAPIAAEANVTQAKMAELEENFEDRPVDAADD
jgi:hypothetical protein